MSPTVLRRPALTIALVAGVAVGTMGLHSEYAHLLPVAAVSRPAAAIGARPVNGETIGDHPTVSAGRSLTFSVSGFAPGSTVTVTLVCQSLPTTAAVADVSGVARISYVVPALRGGDYELSVSGPGAAAGARPSAPAGGDLQVAIPRLAVYPFRVGLQSGPDRHGAASAGHPGGPTVHGGCTPAALG